MLARQRDLLNPIGWAVLSAVIALICATSAMVIITISDNKNVETWKVQPTVLLAVLSSVFNVCLAAMLTVSVAICWWRTAMRGTTLARLHYIWERGIGSNFTSALFSGFDVNKVTAVTVIVAIAKFINNPLLQQATYVQSNDAVVHEGMKLDLVQRLPDGWMGKQYGDTWNSFRTGPKPLSCRASWWRNDTITTLNMPGYYCDGTCEGEVKGAGIRHNCTSVRKDLDLSVRENGTVVFAINSTISISPTGVPFMLMRVLYLSAVYDNCKADLIIETCKIEAAVVKYPLILQNNTITLNREKLFHMDFDSIYNAPGDSILSSRGAGVGPLKGLSRFLSSLFYADARKYFDPSANTIFFDGSGTLQDLFYSYEGQGPGNPPCTTKWKWSSPTDYLLRALIHYMFISALAAGKETNATEMFEVNRTQKVLIFRLDYYYLAGALTTMLLALIGVFYLLWGSWELDRPVGLSPLETSKAFNAPLMGGVDRNDVRGILNGIGHKRVIYDGEKMSVGE